MGFHHHRLNWLNLAEKLHTEQAAPAITLPDSVFPEWHQSHSFAQRSIWKLPNAYFDASGGVIYLRGNAVIESFGGSATKKVRSFKPIAGNAMLISSHSPIIPLGQKPKNYYHWLLEDLPAALRGREIVTDVRAVVGGKQPDYVFQSLEAFGFTGVVRTRKSGYLKNVIVAERGFDAGWPHPNDVGLLRKLISNAVPSSPRERFYVTRRGSRRSLSNELEIENYFRDLGFAVVRLESMSFLEQTHLFSNAEIVVGAHGAGLSNTVFCSPGTHIIELAPARQAIQCFEVISEIVGLTYKRVLINSDDERGAEVSISSLRAALVQFGL